MIKLKSFEKRHSNWHEQEKERIVSESWWWKRDEWRYIIETYNHAVIFDSQNTWDFYINALFINYRYPQTPCPPPIPIWEELPIEIKGIKKFYSKEVLESAQAKNIGYKRIFKLWNIELTYHYEKVLNILHQKLYWRLQMAM